MDVKGAGVAVTLPGALSARTSADDVLEVDVGVLVTVESDESSLSSGQPNASFVFI